jgi:phage shock protein C
MTIIEMLNNLTRSARDRKIGGVCGGIAEATETPSWVWRAAFIISVAFGGLGVFAYVVLWFFMPPARD